MADKPPEGAVPYASGFLWPPMARWDRDGVEFERQTVIAHALPHAATVGKMDNWRAAADEFLRALTAEGWKVVPAASLPDDPAPEASRG